jgi:hypothetical protein
MTVSSLLNARRAGIARGRNAMATDTEMLKLAALDAEDLSVLSAHLQDAVAKVVDMAFLQKEKRFAMLVNRFDWAAAERGNPMRRRAGVHFGACSGRRRAGFRWPTATRC